MDVTKKEKIPRPYQTDALEIALKKNVILCLPTGSGKTFIATIVLKSFYEQLNRKYSEGGKRAFFLVPTKVLVRQQAKAIEQDTTYNVGQFAGDCRDKSGIGIDYWTKPYWEGIFEKYQVFVMTRRIFLDILFSGHIANSSIATVIFDEAHHGAPNAKGKRTNHDYVQIMNILREKDLSNVRIIGLTASLINIRWVSEERMNEMIGCMEQVFNAEVYFPGGCKVFNAKESIWVFKESEGWDSEFPSNTTKLFTEIINMIKSHQGNKNTIVEIDDDEPSDEETLEIASIPITMSQVKKTFFELQRIYRNFGPWSLLHATNFVLMQFRSLNEHLAQFQEFYEVIVESIKILTNLKSFYEQKLATYSGRDAILAGIPHKMLRFLELLQFNKRGSRDSISAIVFVERRLDAFVLSSWLSKVSQILPEFNFIKTDFTVGFSSMAPFPFHNYSRRKQDSVIQKFKDKEINILISTSVLEEGLDINHCNLIIRYDEAKTYRGYVQSKGRARNKDAQFFFMAPESQRDEAKGSILKYRKTEQKLSEYRRLHEATYSLRLEEDHLKTSEGGILPLREAKSRIMFYCDHLPSDGYTVRAPKTEYIEHVDPVNSFIKLYQCKLLLPKISPLFKLQIVSKKCSSRPEAEAYAYYEAVKELWAHNELDDSFRPFDKKLLVSRLLDKYKLKVDRSELREWEEECNKIKRSMTVSKQKDQKEKIEFPPKPGTRKKRRQYPVVFSQTLKGYQSMESLCWLYHVSLKNTEESGNCRRLGLISFNPLPLNEIEDKMSIYSSEDKFQVSLDLIEKCKLKEDELENIRNFQEFIYSGCLKIGFTKESTESQIFFNSNTSPYHLLFTFLTKDKKIDYSTLTKTYERRPINPSEYESLSGALVRKNYGLDQRGLFTVEGIDKTLTPKSPFPGPDYETFEDYYKRKHNISALDSNQPLLVCYAAPTKIYYPCKPDKKMKKSMKSPSRVHLVPELCFFEYFSAKCLGLIYTIPAITTVLNQYLIGSEIRKRLCSEIGYGIAEIPVGVKNSWNQERFTNFSPLKVELAEFAQPAAKPVDLSYVHSSRISISHEDKTNQTSSDSLDNNNIGDITDDSNSSDCEEAVETDDAQTGSSETDEPYSTIHENSDVNVYLPNKPWCVGDDSLPQIKKTAWSDTNMELSYNLADFKRKLEKFKNSSVVSNNSSSVGQIMDTSEFDPLNNFKTENQLIISSDSIYQNHSSSFNYGLPIELIVEAITTKQANPTVNLERLEIMGDSFLKYIISAILFLKLRDLNEARITWLKMNLISNFHLQHVARSKGLASLINDKTFIPRVNWLPPFHSSENPEFNEKEINDKSVADMIEALLGAHLICLGEVGAIKFLTWLGMPLMDLSNTDDSKTSINDLLPLYSKVIPIENPEEVDKTMRSSNLSLLEQKLGYIFKRKDLLIEALTHPSWSRSQFNSYQRLEFLGDAVLDYLITTYIYDHPNYPHLKPGELTIIRQALVNNDYFATISLVNEFDKFIFNYSPTLYTAIKDFRKRLTDADLLGVNKIKLGSFLLDSLDIDILTDAPKALGDIFESIAGAIYLDSGNSLATVWQIYSKFLGNELEFFCAHVPKSPILRLHESFPEAKFVSEKIDDQAKKRLVLIVGGWSFKVDENKLLNDGMTKRAEKLSLVLSALEKLTVKVKPILGL